MLVVTKLSDCYDCVWPFSIFRVAIFESNFLLGQMFLLLEIEDLKLNQILIKTCLHDDMQK